MVWTTLNRFVERSISAGIDREQIANALEEAGWKPDQIQSALESYSESDLPIAVPRPAVAPTAKALFIYLLIFSSLYMTLMGLGTILYQLINLAFPDPNDRQYTYFWCRTAEENLRSGIATLAVFLPAYFFLDWKIERQRQRNPDQGASNVRRKLTYLTLYISAVVLMSDAMYFVDSWLSGELTQRVLLKCLVVALLGSVVLGR